MGKLDELMRSAGANMMESASLREVPSAVAVAATAPASLASARMAGGVARSKTALEVPVDRIVRDPAQPREEFDPESLARLAESMQARGQLQPIRVRWDEAQERYVIICGERRWRAARMAGMATMSCVVAEGAIAGDELLALQLVENALREDLRPIEQARAFRALMQARGWSGSQLARELGIAQPAVVHALRLLDLPRGIQAAVEQGELAPSVAYEISKLDDPREQAEVAARVVDEGLSRAETVEAVRRSTAGAKAAPKKVTARTFRTPHGPRVTVEWGRGLDDDSIRTALAVALETMKATADAA
jgi:ParB family transcriptional regulator, chromosome partitioning protein